MAQPLMAPRDNIASIRANASIPCPNLFLRHLPPHMMEPQLDHMLSNYGPLKRLTVWKDHQTRQSKGFGMAEFENTESAMAAAAALQGKELVEGHPLEVEYHHGKRRHDGQPDIGAPCTNVYVRGLPQGMKEDEFRSLLTEHGEIKRLTIWKDQFGTSKGFGMCEFASPEQARAAMEKLRCMSFDGRNTLHVEVNPPKPRNSQHHHSFAQQTNLQHIPVANLFIKGLPLSYDEGELQSLVSRYGHVKRATIWKDRTTGQSKGFGLVEFGDVNQATAALRGLDRYPLGDGMLHVEYNHPRQGAKPHHTTLPPNQCSNIFVKSLPLNFTDNDLHNLLSPFGRIIRSTIWKDSKTNQSRGFGFCEFASPASATTAIHSLNGKILHGSATPIHVELHTKTTAHPGAARRPPMQHAPAVQFGGYPPVGGLPPLPVDQPASVVVKNLPQELREEDMKNILQRHGRVRQCQLYKDRSTDLVTAMVTFDNYQGANAAIQALNNTRFTPESIPIQLELTAAQVLAEEVPRQAIAPPVHDPFFQEKYLAQPLMAHGMQHRPSFP